MSPSAWRRPALCCVLLLVVLQVGGQPTEDVDPFTGLPRGGQVSVTHVLPEHPQKLFPAGDVIPILLGFRNEATAAYNISMIAGSLNSLANTSMHIQNFGRMGVGISVPPGVELSIEYKFRPDPALTPVEFNVAITVFYTDESGERGYSSTFFNETIDIIESEKFFDTEVLFMYVTIICLMALIAFGIFKWIAGLSMFRKVAAGKKPKKQGARTGEEDDDWLKGTPSARIAGDKKKGKAKKEVEKKVE